MNIYGHLNKVNEIFLDLISQRSNFVPLVIINKFKDSWVYIEKYIKNAHPNWTINWNHTLKSLDPNDLAFSEDMIKDTFKRVEKIVKERKVKEYFKLYISIVEGLTIFNRSYEESCDVCQGELQYYTNTISNTVLKECRTCGCLYNSKNGNKIGSRGAVSLRPATKSELLSQGIIE